MRRRADHYEQILLRAGKPLHYRKLAEGAVRLGYKGNPRQHQSVTNILVKDPRFVPIAQSGVWALTRWRGIERRTITEIAFREIKSAGRPLHEDKLYSSIAKKRRVKKGSIPQMLAQSSRFKKTGLKLWAIRE